MIKSRRIIKRKDLTCTGLKMKTGRKRIKRRNFIITLMCSMMMSNSLMKKKNSLKDSKSINKKSKISLIICRFKWPM